MSKQYPRAKYHASESPSIVISALVHNPEEEAALGEGWFDHPFLMNNPVFLENGTVVDGELAPEPKAQPPILEEFHAIDTARLLKRQKRSE